MPGNWRHIPPSDADPSTPAQAAAPAADEGTWPGFEPVDARRTLDDLVVPDPVRHRIDVALNMLDHHQVLYETWNLKRIDPHRRGTALNLYGPSGTGKSLCAEALAHRSGRKLINVSYAEIESRYVGETPKNIVRCFEAARTHDAVLVFDEADSILGSRLSDVRQSADHSVNVARAVMLSQLDRFTGLVVFTSNFPKNYDAAFVRRILVHVRFELPDEQTRLRLWRLLLPPELPTTSDLDVDALAAESEGLAGGDLANVIIAAAASAVHRDTADRLVSMTDFRLQLRAARQARTEVGKTHPGTGLDDLRPIPAQSPLRAEIRQSAMQNEQPIT